MHRRLFLLNINIGLVHSGFDVCVFALDSGDCRRPLENQRRSTFKLTLGSCVASGQTDKPWSHWCCCQLQFEAGARSWSISSSQHNVAIDSATALATWNQCCGCKVFAPNRTVQEMLYSGAFRCVEHSTKLQILYWVTLKGNNITVGAEF